MHPLRFYTLWAINGPLDERRLCQQLDAMRSFGFDGAVFHPRFYPGVPAYLGDKYMAVLSRTILYAKSIGMDIWIYDEDGWPSGTVGGRLLVEHPDVRQQWADLVREPPGEPLGSFDYDGTTWHLARRHGSGVDYLNPALSHHFLVMTHERYRAALDAEAFAHVSAFFCDEPEFGLGHAFDALSPHGSIPWTPMLPELYESRYGEPLADALPLLFLPLPGHEQARVRFWELLTDVFCDSFIQPINQWCLQHGKRLTAHVKGEEHPLFQVPTHGSASRVFRHLSLPAIDALERDPSNDFFPRQLTSAARQFGDGRSMVECFGGAGWGATPDDFYQYLLWLGGHGITDFVVHLWQYQLDSHAARDWPASIPNYVGWSPAFAQLLRQAKPQMQDAAGRAGVDQADTLLISPHRGIAQTFEPRELLQMNVHDAGTYADTPAAEINDHFMAIVADLQLRGVAYHVTDERTLDDAVVEGNLLSVRQCTYHSLLLPAGVRPGDIGMAVVQRFASAGGSVEVPSPRTLQGVARMTRAVGGDPVSVRWRVTAPIDNALPRDVWSESPRHYRASFVRTPGVDGVSLHFLDAVSNVAVNGRALAVVAEWDDFRAIVPETAMTAGENEVTFEHAVRIAGQPVQPMVWVTGRFAVVGSSPWRAGPNGTVKCDPPLTLLPPPPVIDNDLTTAGYAFAAAPVSALATVEVPIEATAMQLIGIAADAARVRLGNLDCGFVWGPDWTISLPASVEPGELELSITLYPSAYNRFGPHHHYQGDRHVVSPVQFTGVKNFAEDADAPQNTYVPQWHVKPLRLASGIVFRGVAVRVIENG